MTPEQGHSHAASKLDQDGILSPDDTRWQLRFTRRLAHSPEKVWRALTEQEHLVAWFPQRIVGQWIVGAPLRFVSDFGDFEGDVLAVEPPRLLEFRWGTDTIRLEVVPTDDGCLLTLADTFDERGKGARDAAGWHLCLDALEQHLADVTPTGSTRERWQALHQRYVKNLGPEAATIGPPEQL